MKASAPVSGPHIFPVAAVVVTYQPEAVVLENVKRIAAQVPEVIIVDNGSRGDTANWVEAAAQVPGVRLIRNRENLGIATALNIGIRQALQSGWQWVATFDQDTAVPEHYFEHLLAVYDACPATAEVGMIVAGGWRETGGTRAMPEPSQLKSNWSFVRGAVNSGSVIKAVIFQRVGFYDDALFIDYVDTDFCLRLQQHGFKILSANSVILEHELGERQTRHLLGLKVSFCIHTAWRYYYIMRNRWVLYHRFLRVFPGWVLFDGRRMLMEMGRIAFLEHGRKAKLQAAWLGVRDGMRGRTGRHPQFPPPRK